MARARFYHILGFLHFTDNMNGVDRTDDRLENTRLVRKRTDFSKFYNPSEYFALDEVIVKF